MYSDDNGNMNGNGKRKGPVTLLGEIAADFLGATIPNPLVASAFRVVSRNVQNVGGIYNVRQPRPVAAPRPLPGIYGVLQQKLLAQRQAAAAAPKPSINVVTLPNGTAVPGAILSPSSNGGGPAAALPAWTPSMEAGAQGAAGGSSFGPPSDSPPVEIGTLPVPPDGGDSTGGFSLAGLGSGSPLLLLAAAAAFFLLDGKQSKRRRR